MIRVKRKLWLLLVCNFLLSGCACGPEQLGINSLEWESYSKEKQQSLLASYNETSKERKQLLAEQNFGDVFLMINIFDGKIMLPPKFINWQNYRPVQFTILQGQCLDVGMTHLSNDNIKTTLGVCYVGNTLYLDPSRYDPTKKFGTVTIPFSPLWLGGFTYNGIDSHGYVKLNGVSIKIQQQELESLKAPGND